MNTIKIKSKDINIEFDYNKLIDIILKWPLKERIELIDIILSRHKGDENPLLELAKQQYKNCVKNAISFDEMSQNPIFKFTSEAYKNVSIEYQRTGEKWKVFLSD